MDTIAGAMGFPSPLWFRPLWWWQKVYEDWKSGADVDDKLQDREYEPSRHYRLLEEWGYDPLEPRGVCTLEQAARLLQVSEEDVLDLLSEGELATNARALDVSGGKPLEMIDPKLSVEVPGSAGSALGISLSSVVDKPDRQNLAAALLDLGNHQMLCAEERRALRLRKKLSSARACRLGIAAAALRAGARRLDDLTLEIPIGERAQEGNPKRTLALSCVVYGTPVCDASDPPEDISFLFWRVANRPSPGHRGPSVTVDVTDLDRALISYYARPLRIAGGAIGARFFDEGRHEGSAR